MWAFDRRQTRGFRAASGDEVPTAFVMARIRGVGRLSLPGCHLGAPRDRWSYTLTCCRHSKGWQVGTDWLSYRTSTTTSSGPPGFLGNLIWSARPNEPAVTSRTARCSDT